MQAFRDTDARLTRMLCSDQSTPELSREWKFDKVRVTNREFTDMDNGDFEMLKVFYNKLRIILASFSIETCPKKVSFSLDKFTDSRDHSMEVVLQSRLFGATLFLKHARDLTIQRYSSAELSYHIEYVALLNGIPPLKFDSFRGNRTVDVYVNEKSEMNPEAGYFALLHEILLKMKPILLENTKSDSSFTDKLDRWLEELAHHNEHKIFGIVNKNTTRN